MDVSPAAKPRRKIAFMFPAQGVEAKANGQHLLQHGINPLQVADSILRTHPTLRFHGFDKDRMGEAQNAFVAVTTQSMLTARLLEARGLYPQALAGYSLGEYSALAAAGMFGLRQGIEFAFNFGKRYQEAFPSTEYGMEAVLCRDIEGLQRACASAGNVFVSNYNCPGSYLISGLRSSISLVKASGIRARFIPTSVKVPSHTPLVERFETEMAAEIDSILSQGIFRPDVRLVSSVTGSFVSNSAEIKQIMRRHLSSTVLWEDAVKNLLADGVNTFIEVGPGDMLSRLVSRIAAGRAVQIYTTDNEENLDEVLKLAA